MCLLVSVCALSSGCLQPALQNPIPEIVNSGIPRELEKMTYPTYRVEAPDILLIEAVATTRPAEDPLRAGDELIIRATNTLPQDPDLDAIANEFRIINNIYRVQTDGSVDLGPEYGAVEVAGLTVDDAKTAVIAHLQTEAELEDPKISISMPDVSGKQQVSGEHLVRPDGTISLGVYGNVFVSGMTLDEVKAAVESQLGRSLHEPEVTVDVLAYNSKVFYVITDGGGFGEQVVSLPCTGNETVLDAIAQIQGLSEVSSKKVWVSRPAPAGTQFAQTMTVDWRAITEDGIATTNYQIFPGDRIYIMADHLIEFDNFIVKVASPFERLFGFVLLGNGMVRRLQQGAGAFAGGAGGVGGGF